MARTSDEAGNTPVIRTFRESPLAVKAILGGVFINRVGGFLNIFIVLYLTSKGYSAEQAAIALGVYGGGAVAGVLLGGALADRLGARNATVISMMSVAVLTASLLYLPSYGLLLGAVCLLALIGQMYRPASATLLSVLTPENRQVMIFAMYRFGLNLGATAAPLIGFGLYNLGDKSYRLLFWGEALIALGYALLAWMALPGGSDTAGDSSAPDGSPGESEGVASGYRAMLRDRRYTFYLIGTFLNSAVYAQYLSTLPLDVNASHVKILWYTVAVSVNGAIVIAFELPLTKVSQHWPYKLTIGAAFLLVGVGVAFYGLPLGPAVILLGTLIWTLGEIIGAPAAFAYPGIAGPAHLKARYIGSFQFMFGLGAAVGPVAGVALFTQLGHKVWPVIAVASLLAFAFGVTGVRGRQKSEVPEAEEPSAVAAG